VIGKLTRVQGTEYLEGSHPHAQARVHEAYNLPSVPQIFFANPMYRLTALQIILTEAQLNPDGWTKTLSADEIEQSRKQLSSLN